MEARRYERPSTMVYVFTMSQSLPNKPNQAVKWMWICTKCPYGCKTEGDDISSAMIVLEDGEAPTPIRDRQCPNCGGVMYLGVEGENVGIGTLPSDKQ